jgi:hypothetical protein
VQVEWVPAWQMYAAVEAQPTVCRAAAACKWGLDCPRLCTGVQWAWLHAHCRPTGACKHHWPEAVSWRVSFHAVPKGAGCTGHLCVLSRQLALSLKLVPAAVLYPSRGWRLFMQEHTGHSGGLAAAVCGAFCTGHGNLQVG